MNESTAPESRGELGWSGALMWWAGTFAVIAAGMFLYAGVQGVASVALAAVISLVLLTRERRGSYRGRVVDIQTVEEVTGRGRHRNRHTRTYAFIEEDSGEVRRELLIDDTVQVGDRVEKRDGEVTFHKV